MSDAAMTMTEFEAALASLSKLLVETAHDLERAEAQLDDVMTALAKLLFAVDQQSWPMIHAAVRDANRAMLGARDERAAR
jgi:uncharacterized protein Yka (UPF0111/DUF47 family)